MEACSKRDLAEARLIWNGLGQPCLRDKLGKLDLLSGEDCTPLDAVVLGHQIDFDLATGLSEDHSALIEFLQGASCRVSHRSLDTIQHIFAIVTLCEQGLDNVEAKRWRKL